MDEMRGYFSTGLFLKLLKLIEVLILLHFMKNWRPYRESNPVFTIRIASLKRGKTIV